MATRFYFPLDEAAAVSPSIQGSYLHTNTLRRRLRTTPDTSTLTTVAYTPDAADHGVAGAAHHRQYVSDQLAAQNISGTFELMLQGLEAHANNNLFLDLIIFVVSSDGATIKETLFAQTADDNEIPTALTARSLTGTITPADVEANDRVVVQIAVSGTPGGGGGVQGHNASIRWGCNAAGGDIPSEGSTATDVRGWIEFSDSLFISPTRGLISFAEVETPFVGTRGLISFAEGEFPLVPTRGLITWTELEIPIVPTRGLSSWAEFEVPSLGPSPTRGLISWTEAEVPFQATRGLVSFSEFELPLVQTRGLISFAVFEISEGGVKIERMWFIDAISIEKHKIDPFRDP